MNLRLSNGGAAVTPGMQAWRATPPAQPSPSLECAASRAAGLSGSHRPAQSIKLPLTQRLAAAFATSRMALTDVVSLFESVSQGQSVPIALAEHTVDRLLAQLDEDPDALVSLLRLKAHGDYACMHSVAVCALMACLARRLGLQDKQRRQAALAGLLHDIGKAFVPARVLGKPGRLSDDEFAVVRGHPRLGFETLDASPGIADPVKDVAHHHHERFDGRGYPDRLAGKRITLLARMGAVCDVYDAITSNRPYKDGWEPAAAMHAMAQWAQGGQFDMSVASAFAALMGRYPIGSLVRLRSERLAVVNARLGDKPYRVGVTAFHCLRSGQAIDPEILEVGMVAPAGADAIVGPESNATWRFVDLDTLWAGDLALRATLP